MHRSVWRVARDRAVLPHRPLFQHLFVCPLSRLVGLEKLNRLGTEWNNQWTGQDFMGCNFLFLLVDALAARLFSKYPT